MNVRQKQILENAVKSGSNQWKVQRSSDYVCIVPNYVESDFDWDEDNIELRSIVIQESKLDAWMKGEIPDEEIIVSRGFPKFFNFFETKYVSKFVGEKYGNTDLSNYLGTGVWMEKVDGSCLLLSKHNGQLIIRTRPTVSVVEQLSNCGNKQQLLELDKLKNELGSFLDNIPEGTTVAFEWTTPSNRIVIDYGNQPKLYLTGIIRNADGNLYSQDELDSIAEQYGLRRPKRYATPQTLEELNALYDTKDIEGFCVYINDNSIVKIKTAEYLLRFKVKFFKFGVRDIFKIWCENLHSKDERYLEETPEEFAARCTYDGENMLRMLRINEELTHMLDMGANNPTQVKDIENALSSWCAITHHVEQVTSYIINAWLPKFVMDCCGSSNVQDKSLVNSVPELCKYYLDSDTDSDAMTRQFVCGLFDFLKQALGESSWQKLYFEQVEADFVGTDTKAANLRKNGLIKFIALKLKNLYLDKDANSYKTLEVFMIRAISEAAIRWCIEALYTTNPELNHEITSLISEFGLIELTPCLVVVRGLPGSGKSTFANGFRERFLGLFKDRSIQICSADDSMVDLETGEYKFEPERLPEVHAACFESAKEAMDKGINFVIIDNTNVQDKHFGKYLALAEEKGYTGIIYITDDMQKVLAYKDNNPEWYLKPEVDALLSEFAERNKHGVSKEVITGMLKKWSFIQ